MKVGIIGLGFRLGYLGYVFKSVDESFEIVGYVDPKPAGLPGLVEKGISVGKAYAFPARADRQREARSADDRLAQPFHLEHIRIGLEAGLKVFCEKPIVTTIAESIELAHLMAKFGHERLMVGLVLRYSPLYRDLQAVQAAGNLGQIVSIEASEHIEPYHGAFFMRDWRRYERYSGSFMLENAATISTFIMALSAHGLSALQASAAARASRLPTIRRAKASTISSCSIASRAAGWARTRCSTAMPTSSITRSRSSNTPMASA
jgi:predicted dehydrogenase